MRMHDVVVPGDKSISHRALILSALARGRSRVRGILESEDIASTAGILRAYGVAVPRLASEIEITGVGLRGLGTPAESLDCGNSGTSARLLLGIAAALPFDSRFIGDASLSRRPMRRLTSVLEAMGARFTYENSDGLPLTVHGAELRSIDFVNEKASAQIKSALLLAGLIAGVTVRVNEPRPSRDHTETMLATLGARILRGPGTVEIGPTEEIDPLDIRVPGDPSSAAFFAAFAALADGLSVRLPGVSLNPTRTGFFRALGRMGATVRSTARNVAAAGEPTGDIEVAASQLQGIEIAPDEIPAMVDELPLVAVLGTRALGETRVTGAQELRVKESDRIAAMVSNLRAVGADADELPDGFVVRGSSRPLSGRVTTHADHRIAMAFGVLGALPGNNIEVDDRNCVAISYPGFWQQLGAIRAT